MPLSEADDELRDLTLQSFTGSALFERTFDEGMSLVEETARYLDGRGREESRDLPRKAALLYAGESMRVTTRLMQAASWLLIQRAVHEGEMDSDMAASERYRLGSKEICLGGARRERGFAPRQAARSSGAQRQSLPPHRAAGRRAVQRPSAYAGGAEPLRPAEPCVR